MQLTSGYRILFCGFLAFYLSWMSWPAFAKKSRKPLGARSIYNQAVQYFNKGKYRQSAEILIKLVKKYPKFKPGYFLLGRIYFRYGKLKRAAYYFKKSGASFVKPATAFEYGVAMFSIGACTSAIKALKKVPSHSEFKDLARFYLGVCYARKRNFYLAENYLIKARKIPVSFQQVRREYLAEIRLRRRQQRLARVPRSVPFTPIPVNPPQVYSADPNMPGLPDGPGAPPKEAYEDLPANSVSSKPGSQQEPVKVEKPAAPTKGLTLSVTPKVEYLNSSLTQDKHQRGKSTLASQGMSAAVNADLRYLFQADREGKQNYLFNNFNVNFENLTVSGKSTTFTDNDGEILEDTVTSNAQAKNLDFSIEPGTSVALTKDLNVKASGLYGQVWPDAKQDFSEVFTGGRLHLSVSLGNADISASVQIKNKDKLVPGLEEVSLAKSTQTDISGDFTMPVFEQYSLSAGVSQSSESEPSYGGLGGYAQTMNIFGGVSGSIYDFNVNATVTHSQNTQPNDLISGTEQQIKGVLEASVNLAFSLTAKGGVEMTQIQRFIQTGLCTQNEEGVISDCGEDTQTAVATGTRQGFTLSIDANPVDWAYASVSFSHHETRFVPQPAELTEDFKSKVVDWTESLSFIIGLTTSF